MNTNMVRATGIISLKPGQNRCSHCHVVSVMFGLVTVKICLHMYVKEISLPA